MGGEETRGGKGGGKGKRRAGRRREESKFQQPKVYLEILEELVRNHLRREKREDSILEREEGDIKI